MQGQYSSLFFFFLSTIVISFIILHSLSINFGETYAQSQIINPIDSPKFLNYYNSSVMIKIKYPSFWQKPIPVANDTIFFLSPVKTMGVIIQNKPTSNESIDEISLKTINDIKNSFSNVKILNMNISTSKDGSIIQKLEFTYGSSPDTFRELQVLKLNEDRAFTFIYYADNALFNQFFPIASIMYNSLQTPKFFNTFSQEQILNPLKLDKQINQPIKSAKNITIPSNLPIVNKQNNQSSILSNDSIFYNKLLGIKIQYPNSLNKIESDRGASFNSYNKSIGVTLVNIPINNMTESDFIAAHIMSLNNSLTNFDVINASTSDLLGYPTQMIVFSYNNGAQLYKGMQFWKIAEDHVYIFTYYAQSDRLFDKFLPLITKMVDSLQLT
jgi:hypothetical protein